MDFKGSETEKNLYRTFAGECRASIKYNLFAEVAEKEGYKWIAKVYRKISLNEYAHARKVYKEYLDRVCSTEDNLIDAALSEANENENIYKKFEEIAEQECFEDIKKFFSELREVEAHHKDVYNKLLKDVQSDKVFKCDKMCYFECLNCGYIYEGREAPKKCPLCGYPTSYFRKIEDYDCLI